MGQFGMTLQMAFEEVGWSQSDAATQSGIVTQSTISRYIRGDTLPEKEKLEALISHMPSRVQERVTLAYLADQIPSMVGEKVRVEIADGAAPSRERILYGRAPEGSILRKDLDKLELLALKNPNLAKTINYMVASLEGTMDPSPYDEDSLSVQERGGEERPEEAILAKVRRKKRKND